MIQTIQAKNITLGDLIANFGIELVEDEQFFREWQDNQPEITELDRQLLDRLKAGFINLLNYPPLLEDLVRMSVLDPLLFLAGFYLSPFHVKSEKSVAITSEDEEVLITGSLDSLVLRDRLWVMAIEAKKAEFSIEAGLAQLLAYMLAAPDPAQPGFGMITTGGNFIFVKLVCNPKPRYALSDQFTLRKRQNELYCVLKILKRLGQQILKN